MHVWTKYAEKNSVTQSLQVTLTLLVPINLFPYRSDPYRPPRTDFSTVKNADFFCSKIA